MRNRLLSSQPIWQQQCLTLLRVVVGLLMVYHGKEVFDPTLMKTYAAWDTFKGSPYANALVYAGKASEFIAGVLLTIGFLTRIAALLLIGTMLYIIFFIGHGKIWYEDQHPFMFVLMGVLLFSSGGGPYSIDHLLTRNRHAHRNHQQQ